jgi:hypothetical protein
LRALANETWEQILAHDFPDAAPAPFARPGM